MLTSRKVALVTGGVRRLGRCIAEGLAESGHDLIITYHSSPKSAVESALKSIRGHGVEASALKCNVASVKEISALSEELRKRSAGVDVLVNNAAIFRRLEFARTTESEFDEFIDTNLKSVFFMSQAIAPLMKGKGGSPSKIINISSMGAFENWTGFMPYCVSKAGVVKLTELLALKLAPEITVNSVAPGTIMITGDKNSNVNRSDVLKYPVGRFGVERDIVSIVKYLAGENSFITGQTIKADGGKSLK